jgi:hypothetical protein
MSLLTNNVLGDWDGHIQMQNVIEEDGTRLLDWMELIAEIPCGDEMIPVKFRWNGASVGIIRRMFFLHFPKWKHPIATCRHDARCAVAETVEERKFADTEFQSDIAKGGTKFEVFKGYWGVRIGAWIRKVRGKLI